MIALKQILVPTDFSAASTAALTYGRVLAHRFGAELHVLHVMENGFLRPTAADPLEIEAATRQILYEQVTDDDRLVCGRAVLERSDNVPDEIVRYATASGIDLVVMGTHGRGTLSQLLLGSVAERVVRTARCPVLTVRHPDHESAIPAPVACRTGMH